MKSYSHDVEHADIKAAANAWWVRLDSDVVNARERAEFAAWLNADPRHRQAYEAVSALWGELDAVKHRIVLTSNTVTPKNVRRWRWVAPALASAFLSLWLFGPLSIWFQADYRTGLGEMRDIRLSDGSMVYLNGNSALAVYIVGTQRQLALLQGEAWFKVSPDKARPFRVRAGEGVVTALGTAFNIRLFDGQTEVSVTEHRVAIDGGRRQDFHTELGEGHQLLYGPQGGISEERAIDSQAVTAWQRGKLVFQNRPLGEVIAELNRYHRGYLAIADRSLAQRRVNGVFRTDQPLVVLNALETSLKLHSTRLGDYLVLLHR